MSVSSSRRPSSADDIPPELVEHISEFRLPTGAKISWRTASRQKIDGWVVEVPPAEFVYADGQLRQLPRFQVFVDLGFPGGEDDLRSDDDWRAVSEREDELTRLLLMDLPTAWARAREKGLCNRLAEDGETAWLRETGEQVVVTNAGRGDYERGEFVRVRHKDGNEGVYHLWSLCYDDPNA